MFSILLVERERKEEREGEGGREGEREIKRERGRERDEEREREGGREGEGGRERERELYLLLFSCFSCCSYWRRTVAFFHLKIHYQNKPISCLLFFLKLRLILFFKQEAIHWSVLIGNFKMKKSHCPAPILVLLLLVSLLFLPLSLFSSFFLLLFRRFDASSLSFP